MIGVADAKKILSQRIAALPAELLSVHEAVGRVTAEDIFSGIDVPVFDNSAMDGYAIRFNPNVTSFRLTQHIQAGDSSAHSLRESEAARIFTGAPVPAGADTVIQQELAVAENGSVSFDMEKISRGLNIRMKGTQCRAGEKIVTKRSAITPGLVALLSSVGITKVKVFRQPTVKVIVTGNELCNPGEPLQQGKIYNTNQPALLAYLKILGIADMDSIQIKDELNELQKQVAQAIARYDVVIFTGGISVGDHDHVKQALANENVETLFYKIKQKPGKPMYAGVKNGKLIFALPGNPAAVITCFNQYVKPGLLQMMGHYDTFAPSALLPLAHDWEKKGSVSNILKARVEQGAVTLLHGQDSFNLLPFSEANAFALLHEDDLHKKKGELVEVFNW